MKRRRLQLMRGRKPPVLVRRHRVLAYCLFPSVGSYDSPARVLLDLNDRRDVEWLAFMNSEYLKFKPETLLPTFF